MNGGTSDNVGSRHVRARLDESCINEAPRRGPNAGVPHTVRRVGGKDRHSKVNTAKGLRDRRVRLSAATAIQFFDVQDRLGFDQPSKAVDWLIKQAQAAIDKLGKVPDTDTKLAMASSSSSSQVKKEEEREASKVSGGSDVKALKDGDGARSRSGTAQDQLDLAIDSHQNHQQRQQAILEHSLPLPANRSFIMQSPEIMQYFAHQIQQLPCSVLPRQTHLQSLPMVHPSSSLQPYLEDRSNRITAASNQMPSAAPIDLFLQQHHHHLHAGLSSVPFQADSSARSVVLSQAVNHSISSSPMQLQQVHNTRRAGLPMINNMSMTQQADAPRLANLMHPSLPNRGTLQSISSFNSYTPFMNLAGNNNAFHNVHDSGIYRMLSAMAGKDDNGFLQTSSVPITPSRIFDINEMDQEGSGLPSSL